MSNALLKASSEEVSRREFARRVALATAAVAVLPASILPSPREAPAPSRASGAAKPLSSEAQAELEAKFQAILRRYGARLTEEQKKDIHRLLTEGQRGLEKLRAFPLVNSNNPGTVFIPYRGKFRAHHPRLEK